MTRGTKPDTWMPLFIGDYLKDTARLSTEQHGAYMLLIMDYWTNGPPADDDEELAAITRLDLKTWRRHRPKIERFFRIDGNQWRHKRVDEEIEAAQGKSDKAAEKARTAAQARWGKDRDKQPSEDAPSTSPSNAKADAPSMLEECPSPSPSPKEVGPKGPVGSAAPPDVRKADIDRLWSLAPARGRERSSRKDVERSLRAALRRGHAVDAIAAGVESYYSSEAATKDAGEYAKGLHRLIENDRWKDHAPGGELFATDAKGAPKAPAYGPRLRNPPEMQQRAWMRDWVSGEFEWKEADRGPPPGQAGCQVSAEIQREHGVEPAKPHPVRGAA